MTKIPAALLFVLLLSAPAHAETPWYDGGTLQKGTAGAWLASPDADRLATSADFLAAFNGVTDISRLAATDLDTFKRIAVILEGCISAKAKADLADTPVAALATACFLSEDQQFRP